jgi:hypothetical protein
METCLEPVKRVEQVAEWHTPLAWYHFDSVEQLGQFGLPKSGPVWRDKESWFHASDLGFVGRSFADIEEASDALFGEWPEGEDMFNRASESIEIDDLLPPSVMRRQNVWREDDGNDFDYDRLRAGTEFWRGTRKREIAGAKIVTIVVDMGTPHVYEADSIIWRGVCALIVCQLLERAGYRCEIVAARYSENCYPMPVMQQGMVTLQLKTAAEPLDIRQLINPLAGWAYRTAWFGAYYRFGYRGTYGTSRLLTPEVLGLLAPQHQSIYVHSAWELRDCKRIVRSALTATGLIKEPSHV